MFPIWSKEDTRCEPLARVIVSIASVRKSYGARPGDVRYFIDRPLLDHPQTHQRDGIKYSTKHHYHTRSAIGLNTKLLHLEHAVPISILWQNICSIVDNHDSETSIEKVLNFLSKNCRVAILTRTEHDQFARIGLKDKMPPGWDGLNKNSDPWMRYTIAGVELLPPTG